MLEKTIKTYYGISFANGLAMSFFFATYVLFMINSELSLLEVNLVNCSFMAACFLLEFPTGLLADNVSRKLSVVASFFLHALGMFVYYLSGSFWMFVFAEVILAVATTFYSGAFEAWLVDSVKHYQSDYDLSKVFRRSHIFEQSGMFVGVVVGAYAGVKDLSLPWLFSAIGFFIVGVIAYLVMREDGFYKPEEKVKITVAIRDSIYYGIKNRAVFFIIITGVVFFFAVAPFNMYYQLVFKSFGLGIAEIGWLHDISMLFMIVGAVAVKHVSTYFESEKKELIFVLFFLAVSILVASVSNIFSIVLIGYMAHEVARGAFRPLRSHYINEKIPSENRATLLSFDSMITRMGMFSGLLVSGVVANNFGEKISWLVSGVVLLLILPLLLKMKNGD